MSGEVLPKPAPGPLTVRPGGWAGAAWAVFDREGKRVSEKFADKADAESARDALAAQQKARPCLHCGTPFPSEGKHNRLCDRCRQLDAGPVPTGWARRGRPGEGART